MVAGPPVTPCSVPAGFHGARREPSALQHQGEGCPGPSAALGEQRCARDMWRGPHACAQHLKCVPPLQGGSCLGLSVHPR